MCRILEVCSSTNISKLQFGNLCVEFGAKEKVANQSPILPPISQEEHTQQNDAQIQKDAADLRKMELDELLLTDPARYEELIEKGEI